MSDYIKREDAIRIASGYCHPANVAKELAKLPSAQPERLTDDDFETIRIHLSAYKETLCNQHRWREAEEYQRIIDRFMSFASAQPDYYNISDIDEIWEYYAKEHDLNLTENAQQIKEALWLGYHKGKESAQPKTGYWIEDKKTERENQLMFHKVWTCSQCGEQQVRPKPSNFCPNCGTAMPGIITMYT